MLLLFVMLPRISALLVVLLVTIYGRVASAAPAAAPHARRPAPAPAARPVPAARPSPTPIEQLEVCASGGVVNLRSAPSASARVVDQLPDEFDLMILGTSGNGHWLKVEDDSGRTGWVDRDYTCADEDTNFAVGPWLDPAPGACITSGFGPRIRPCSACSKNHPGVDFGVCEEPVGAVAEGRVISVRCTTTGGNMVVVDHGGGLVSYYLHLRSTSVKAGDRVAAGAKLGIAGHTGTALTGCHLHLEIKLNGRPIDPQLLLPARNLVTH